MAKPILAQPPKFCKVQNNRKLNMLSKKLLKSDCEHCRQAGQILRMSNDDAAEFLRSVGFSQVIPGTHFAPGHDVARFLDIKENCLYNFILRYGMNNRDNPMEAISFELGSFFRAAGLLEVGEVVSDLKTKVFDFHFKNTDSHYVTEYGSSTRMYSARVIAAIIPILARHYSKIDKDCKCASIHAALVEYMESKKFVAKPAKTATPALNEELLYELVKKAVGEVLSGAKVEMTAPFTITT